MTTSEQIFRRQLRRLILVPLVVSLLIAVVLEFQVSRLQSAQQWVDHTDIVLTAAGNVLKTIIDQETGLRGFALSRDRRFLQPYQRAESTLPGLFAELRENISDNREQQNRLEEFQQSYERWHDYSKKAILGIQEHDPKADSVDFNLTGKLLMDDVRQREQEFVDKELQLRQERSERSARTGRALNWTLLGLLGVLVLTLVNETKHNIRTVENEYADILADLRVRSQELLESRERLQVTLRSIGDAVIVTDASGRITFLNPVAEKHTQMPLAQASEKHLDDVFRIINEDTRLKTESPFSKVMRLGTVVGLANHTLLQRPDGSEISIDDSGAPIRDEQGRILGVVLVFRDITEQKEILNTLRTNEKLAAAGKLSASIAHEIHNPLETVRNLFYLIRKGASQDLEHLIGIADQELSRVVQITKNMLSLYRESKKVVPLRLTEVVESVTLLMERRLRDKNIAFSTDFRTDAQISAFPAEMRQVVSNLLGNAIDAVEAGGEITIIIEDSHMRDGGPAVALSVHDNGAGIPTDIHKKLFRPFFTTKGENGTGLGLWITQGIVAKHGGYIEVSSNGSGEKRETIFTVVLPRLGSPVSV